MGWQQNEYVESWLNNAERNESCPAPKSGSRAPTDRSTALITSAPSLPTHPPRLGPRRAISGDLALSRAISGPRRAISGDLGASLARRHTCSKKEGPGWSHGAHVLARCAASLCATFEALARAGEAAPRAARSSPSTPTPARTAHLGPPGVTLALAQDPGDSLPPTSDGLGRFCAPWRLWLCMSRVPARQGWCQGQFNCQGWCQGQLNCLAGAKAQRLSSLSLSSLSTLSTFFLSLP